MISQDHKGNRFPNDTEQQRERGAIPQKIRRYSAARLIKLGVRLNGKGIFAERTVKFERGACLFGPCQILGDSKICSGAQILPFTCIENSTVGANSVVRSSTVIGSYVGADCTVGPYALLRAGSKTGDGCRVGDFVEIKNSVLGSGTKAAHLAYVGDARIGSGVNIGCGVVFANFDGKNKSISVVEDGCFIGCNCNIVAPVFIGKGAYIAAGTTVTRDLMPCDFCIGRSRESVIRDGARGRYRNG